MNILDKSNEELNRDFAFCVNEQQQLKKLLVEAEEIFSAIYDKSPIAIELYDASGNLIRVNNSCLKLFGIEDISEIKGFSLFADPNISDTHKIELSRGESIRYQGLFDFEKVKAAKLYNTVHSGVIWLDVVITPLGQAFEPARGYLIQIQDITERKLSEKAFRDSEEQYRTLYDQAPVGLYRTTRSGQILLANRTILAMLGYKSLEELSQRNLEENGFESSSSREHFIHQIERTGEVKDLEATWISNTGQIRIVRENARAVRDSEGKTIYYDGTVEDITESKRVEKALRETEKKYERMVTNIKDVVYSVDGETGEFTYLSPQFEKLLGYTEDDVLNMGGRRSFLSLILPGGKLDEHEKRFSELKLSVKDQGVTDELWWRCKDGSLKCIADHWTPVYKEGKLISTDGVLRDITMGKQTEEALNEALLGAEASDRLKTAFMNNISHEVRTPLNGILGFAELINNPELSAEDLSLYKEILYESSERLLETINSYMDISLIISGNMKVNKRDFDLVDLLYQGYGLFVERAAAKGVTMKITDPAIAGKLIVNSDADLIKKVYHHLLVNAIKFTEFGKVVIGHQVIGDEIEVSVQDSGIGISDELRDRIFDTFLQADFSNTRKHEGSGLGLAIAKGLIELLDGNIWVRSKVGHGSTFGFSIPYRPGPKVKSDTEMAKTAESTFTREVPVILIAEDDPINIFLLEAMLSKSNAIVWHVENGSLAVNFCRNHPELSLVLMDLKMPEMDGFEATRLIKSFRKELPVIAVTAFAMSGDKELAMDAGCDGYMTKPYTSATLLAKVKEYIRL